MRISHQSSSSGSSLTDLPRAYAPGRPMLGDGGFGQRNSEEYDFLWPGGPVGITLRRSPNGVPMITGFTGKGTSPDIQKCSSGDILLSVQNIPTRDHTFEEVMQILRTCQKPCVLKFRRDGSTAMPSPISTPSMSAPSFSGSSPTMGTSNNSSPQGSLIGLPPAPTLARPAPAKVILPPLKNGEYEILWEHGPLGISIKAHPSGMPIVARKTGKGTSPDLDKVVSGDYLVCINEKMTTSYQFTQVLEILSTVPRPVVLRFKRARLAGSPSPSYGGHGSPSGTGNSFVVTSNSFVAGGPSFIIGGNSSFAGMGPMQMAPPTPVSSENVFVPPLGQGEYDILWEKGRLGLSMRRHPDKNIPIIAKITATPDMAFVKDCKVGDELLYVNDKPTLQMGFKRALQFLATVQKPAVLRFKAKAKLKLIEPIPQSADPPGVYRVVWEYGPLGFTMKEDRMSRCPVIARLTGKGTYPDITKMSPQDMLLSVNDKHTADLGFANTMEFLKTVEKPCLLRFKANDSDKDTVFEYGSDTETVIDDDYQSMIFNDQRYNNPYFDSFPEEPPESMDPLVREERAAGQLAALRSKSPGQDEVYSVGSGGNSLHLGSMDDVPSQGSPSPPHPGAKGLRDSANNDLSMEMAEATQMMAYTTLDNRSRPPPAPTMPRDSAALRESVRAAFQNATATSGQSSLRDDLDFIANQNVEAQSRVTQPTAPREDTF